MSIGSLGPQVIERQKIVSNRITYPVAPSLHAAWTLYRYAIGAAVRMPVLLMPSTFPRLFT